jgi:nuclease-like protein
MLIKSADDKQPDIDALNGLLARPGLDGATRRRVETELRRVQAGARGEREAAYEIEFHYGANPNRMTIHDLRLEVDGRVAQIDHLLIDRLLGVWVCESKHFSEGVAVDDYGEWTGFYNRRPDGIGSPIEQNRKHIAVLNDVFAKRLVELPKRLGITIRPELRSVILVSKEARISRPKTKAGRARVEGLDSVIKIDQLKTLLDRDLDSKGVATLRRFVGKGEIERIARQLVALHRPASTDWSAKLGVAAESPAPADASGGPTVGPASQHAVCKGCGKRVSEAVIEFSQARAEVFGNRILCMDCQRKARKGQI